MENQGWKTTVRGQDELTNLIQKLNDEQVGHPIVGAAKAGDNSPMVAPSASLPNIQLRDGMPLHDGNPESPKVIVVDKANHRTHVLQMGADGRVEEVVNVPNAIGKNPGWTPEGRTHLISKEHMPSYTNPHSHQTVGPGINNPVGVLKMRTTFAGGNIMLHGTPPRWDNAIGTNASHGCVRHHNADILKIGAQVHKGDVVYIAKKFEGTRISESDFRR